MRADNAYWVGILLMLAHRLWIDTASGQIKWEDTKYHTHVWYLDDATQLVRAVKAVGWKGGGAPRGIQYYWSKERLGIPQDSHIQPHTL